MGIRTIKWKQYITRKKKMKWLTKEHIKKEAQKGKMEALKCSWEHHNQGATCTRGELIDALDKDGYFIGAANCACYHYFGGWTDRNSSINCRIRSSRIVSLSPTG